MKAALHSVMTWASVLRRRGEVLSGLVVLVALAGVSTVTLRPKPGTNVILITVDALRRERMTIGHF